MKIAILTQDLGRNYGGILQNYALQQVLIKLGHEPITLEKDYRQHISIFRLILELPKRTFTKYILKKRECIFSEYNYNSIKKANKRLLPFVAKYINLKYIKDYSIENTTKYDSIIVGSDQVWRPIYNWNVLDKMFLSFIPIENKIKRIAYAASFGASDWEFSDEQTVLCKKSAQLFDAISVREDSGVILCKEHLECKATHVLDPTLLLEKVHYLKICKNVPTQNKFLCAYILDLTGVERKQLELIASKKGLVLKIFSADDDCTLTTEQWLAMFRDAELIITNSFHGTAFSLIFNKEFYSLTHPVRGGSRIPSLFRQLNIPQERNITTLSEVLNNTSFLDWNTINDSIKQQQQYSIEFLTKALN